MGTRQQRGNRSDEDCVCVICFLPPKFPKARLNECGHVYCFSCVYTWLKKRSQCALCNCWTSQLTKILESGKTSKINVKRRTQEQYERELAADEEREQRNREQIVSIARCPICAQVNVGAQTLLCDGVVGHSADGSVVRCQAAYHAMCVGLEELPVGRWLCPFCDDTSGTRRTAHGVRSNNGLGSEGTSSTSRRMSPRPPLLSVNEAAESAHVHNMENIVEDYPSELSEYCDPTYEPPIQRAVVTRSRRRRRLQSTTRSPYGGRVKRRKTSNSRVAREGCEGTGRRRRSRRSDGVSNGLGDGRTSNNSRRMGHRPVSLSVDEPGPSWRRRKLSSDDEYGGEGGNFCQRWLSRSNGTSSGPRTSTVQRQRCFRESSESGKEDSAAHHPRLAGYDVYGESSDTSSGSESGNKDKGKRNLHAADSGDTSGESSDASSGSEQRCLDESDDVESEHVSVGEDWDAIDTSVLSEYVDHSYDPAGRTAVTRPRKRKKRQSTRSSGRKRVKRQKKGRKTRNKGVGRRECKNVSRNQLRWAKEMNTAGGCSARRRKRRRRTTQSSISRRSVPRFSLFNSDNDELPTEDEPKAQVPEPEEENRKTNFDVVGTIMNQQTTTLASLHRANCSDGSTHETEIVAEHGRSIDDISRIDGTARAKMETRAEVNNVAGTGTRKNRPTRWGSPTTSVQSTNVTASIPLPTGPPIQQTISLETIPIPNRATMRPPISPQVALAAGPSSLNTSPSTSFALNTFAQPFGVGPSSLCAQPPLGLSSIANAHLGQQHLLQLPPQMFPNLLMQPSFPIGAVNNILAAGLLGNASLGPPISQSGTSLVFGQMQIPSPNQQITQQLANLASLQSATNSQQPRLPLAGVPPPPPVAATRITEVEESLEPLTERIRQLTEANALQSFGEGSTAANDDNKPSKEEPEPKELGGRKSASAEEEETSDVDARTHKNGPMFDQARHMLSESLKKAYKKKRITKDEYKEIMKKGVTALSQRTKLDEKKVHEYANKYIDCVLYRRRKKQVKEH